MVTSGISGQRSSGHVGQHPGVESPALAAGPGLPLPDGRGVLQGIDAPAGRLEGRRPVRRAGSHDDRRLTDGDRARCGAGWPGVRGRASGAGPRRRWPGNGAGSGSRRPRTRGPHLRATFGVVPCGAGEGHDGTTRRQHRPVGDRAHRQHVTGQPHPGEVIGSVHHGPPAYGDSSSAGPAISRGVVSPTLRSRVRRRGTRARSGLPGRATPPGRPSLAPSVRSGPPFRRDRPGRGRGTAALAVAASAGAGLVAAGGLGHRGLRGAGRTRDGQRTGGHARGHRVRRHRVPRRHRRAGRRPRGGARRRYRGLRCRARDDGHVLTTADLVGDERQVTVQPVEGPALDAVVVGTDAVTDIAVLSVAGLDRVGAVLGAAAEVAVGDATRAVTLRGEDAAEVLTGVVANLAVTVIRPDDTPLHGLIGTDIVQDRPVEGAALVDASGAVIGVTTSVGDTDVVRAVPSTWPTSWPRTSSPPGPPTTRGSASRAGTSMPRSRLSGVCGVAPSWRRCSMTGRPAAAGLRADDVVDPVRRPRDHLHGRPRHRTAPPRPRRRGPHRLPPLRRAPLVPRSPWPRPPSGYFLR